LYNFEVHRLLEVSLAYEKTLLPEFSASLRGATQLEAEFAKWRFCSVNAASMLETPQWDFLFESVSEYSIPDDVDVELPPVDSAGVDAGFPSF